MRHYRVQVIFDRDRPNDEQWTVLINHRSGFNTRCFPTREEAQDCAQREVDARRNDIREGR